MPASEFDKIEIRRHYPGGSFSDVLRTESISFVEEPGERILIRPTVLDHLDRRFFSFEDGGNLRIVADNGTVVYHHTGAQDGCYIFERVSWEPK